LGSQALVGQQNKDSVVFTF
jgi:hypothetical protein